ncbi:type II secretion system F family protein [Streptomyces sp. NPDC051561]|uniref:type II secretion system F family protein n=1 Tax=Streptomyces sp. NPDC051561 TaxID=3365658 RepID=UPI0037A22634
MNGVLWWALCGALLTGGLLAVVLGLVGTTQPRRVGALARWRVRVADSAGTNGQMPYRVLLLAAVGVFVAVWLLSGVFMAGLLLGGSVVGVPWLLTPTASTKARIGKLEGLADWAQRLADVLILGFGMEQALITGRKNPPPALAKEVTELADKLQAGWTAEEALRDFADELDDITADKVCASLALSARDSGPGLAQALEDLAASVREEVASRRRIEADREKARTAVRWMTIITVALVPCGFLIPSYTAPYATLLGQLVMALLGLAFIGVLLWMRSLATHRPVARFLIADPRSRVKQAQQAPQETEVEGVGVR